LSRNQGNSGHDGEIRRPSLKAAVVSRKVV
jgi:hypothetical protein